MKFNRRIACDEGYYITAPEEMQALLYEIPKVNGEPDKARQKRFFEIVYNLLLGKTKGPRLYLFLTAINKVDILKLIK